MFYFLLICSIFILACSLFSITRTIRNINKQIKEKRKIRVSLSNRDIEELAYAINQKDTLHKKLQVQIRQEEEQLKQSISNISHDLRTPLTSIQGYLTLLQECEDKQEHRLHPHPGSASGWKERRPVFRENPIVRVTSVQHCRISCCVSSVPRWNGIILRREAQERAG